jgi:hypothetical protein
MIIESYFVVVWVPYAAMIEAELAHGHCYAEQKALTERVAELSFELDA